MEVFKTIFALEILTGLSLVKNGTFRGSVEVIAFITNSGNVDEIPIEQIIIIWKSSISLVREEILKQHSELKSVVEEFINLNEKISDDDEYWFDWAEEKMSTLPEHILIHPSKKKFYIPKFENGSCLN